MNKKKAISLQAKIVGLIVGLIITITLLISVINGYFEYKQTEEYMGKQALQVAIAVSLMPSIVKAFELEDPAETIQPIAQKIRKEIGAEYIVVGNKDGVRYSHRYDYKLGEQMVGGDNDQALIYGQYYISKAEGSLGPALRGKAPIFNDNNEIIGIVSVGYLLEDIRAIIVNRIIKVSVPALIVLVFGITCGVLLARNIRTAILGLEPYEIASLYRERSAILSAVKEGIIAIDEQGTITLINQSAQDIIGIEEDVTHKKIEQVLTNTGMYEVLKTGLPQKDREMLIRNRTVVVNRTPILEKGKIVGVVSSFRDKTELKKMITTLTEVKKYSEGLRAQTHEFSNKLYVLSGLMQLGKYNEAIAMIQEESFIIDRQHKVLFEQILDTKIQAILLGKLGMASEKRIDFKIDENSSIDTLPDHISATDIITVIGNLVDNAFDAVEKNDIKKVSFFAIDIGDDVIIEVTDNGPGIPIEKLEQIFGIGFSTKGMKDRGYGLAIVKQIVDVLGGTIEIQDILDGGTIFSVYLPRKRREEA